MDKGAACYVATASDRIEEINAYIGENIAPYLYLAAYYAPKRHPQDGNYEAQFWCAVTNAYGLLKDCVPPFTSFFHMFYEGGYLTGTEKQHLLDFYIKITGLRSLYCHNCNAGIDGSSKDYMRAAYDFFSEHTGREPEEDTEDFFIIPSLSSKQWKDCFLVIRDELESCVDILHGAVTAVSKSADKQHTIAKWKKLLAEWCSKGRYDFVTIKGELARLSVADSHSRKKLISSKMVVWEIKQMKEKLLLRSGDMVSEYHRVIGAMMTPALPGEVIKALFYDAKKS